MMPAKELLEWLSAVVEADPEACVAVDEGGMSLVVVEAHDEEANYIEVGGVPLEDDE